MKILSHRGYWKTAAEKNTLQAFDRSFSLGLGTETDLRDLHGQLVISHDPAGEPSLGADAFFQAYTRHALDQPLALNIKADGLQGLLAAALSKHDIQDYFVFDMSIPDMLGYIRAGLRVFSRQSEYEPVPALYEHASGVWIDCFETEWVTEKTLAGHLAARKQVCIVSPELHKRPYQDYWEKLSKMSVSSDSNIMLCTDFPEEAQRVFG